MTHSFALCAYGENPNLEETIISLMNQKNKSEVFVATSTPNDYIEGLCKKYDLPLYINETSMKGIAADWNFAYNMSDTDIVTIAHQDDIYDPDYSDKILKAAKRADDPIILFTDYYEIRDGVRTEKSTMLGIKRVMLAPLSRKREQKSVFLRRRMLSLGSPICCPSVAYVRAKVGDTPFDTSFKNSMDYKLYVDKSSLPGSFVYVPKILMGHRIYKESTTTENIATSVRKEEDTRIMSMFWPDKIAKMLNKVYEISEKSNEL